MNAATKAILSWRNGLPRAQPWRGAEMAFHEGRGLLGIRAGCRGVVADPADAVVRVLFDVEPLAFCSLARAGWRPGGVHAASHEHAREAVERASSRDRIWPSLSGTLQVLPSGNGRLLLPSRSIRGAERPASKPRGTRGIVALVEPTTRGARRSRVSDPLDVAFAATCGLDAHRQSTAIRSRIGDAAPLRQPQSALRRSRVGGRHSQAIGT